MFSTFCSASSAADTATALVAKLVGTAPADAETKAAVAKAQA